MYAYCMAAAHLELRHQIAVGFMISILVTLQNTTFVLFQHVEDDSRTIEFDDGQKEALCIWSRKAEASKQYASE